MRLGQDEEFCFVEIDGVEREIRFHDYPAVYALPGLYEQLIYDLLRCTSPVMIRDMLAEQLRIAGQSPASLRVLDLGAGNGIVGVELRALGVEYLVGADIIAEAATAAWRDRPSVYTDYVVADIARLSADDALRMDAHRFTALTCVGALGFGDIPPEAFGAAFNYVAPGGWIGLTVKERFLSEPELSGIGALIKRCSEERILEIRHSTRYQHRLGISGKPLYYTGLVAVKHRDIRAELYRQ